MIGFWIGGAVFDAYLELDAARKWRRIKHPHKKPEQIAWRDGRGDMARQAEMFEFDQRPMPPNKS
jgi:hypothetical protein